MARNHTLADFIASMSIKMTVRPAKGNPLMESADREMHHWNCRLSSMGRQMGVVFSMGSGFNGREPILAEVLDSLASDAAGVENARDFADWCGEYGYDTDSRKAERTYRACARIAKRLQRLCGSDGAYQALLFNTDRE